MVVISTILFIDTSEPSVSGMLEKDIRESYSQLVVRVVGKLRDRNINIDDFRLYLTTNFGCGDFISSISSVSEMIVAVTGKPLWNFYNCYVLEGIIKYFCKDDSEMIGWMEEYKTKLSAFKTATKIVKGYTDADLMADTDEAINDYEVYDKKFFVKLSLKLRKNKDIILRVDQNCLLYIDELWTAISRYFLLISLPNLLEKIRKGCIEITWIVPAAIASIINLMAKSPGCTEFCRIR